MKKRKPTEADFIGFLKKHRVKMRYMKLFKEHEWNEGFSSWIEQTLRYEQHPIGCAFQWPDEEVHLWGDLDKEWTKYIEENV